MSITHTVTRQYKDQSANSILQTESVVGNGEANFDQQVPIGTNTAYAFNLVRSKLLSLCISSDTACTIKTNSSSAPTDTLSIGAGETRLWTLATNLIANCPITADITAGIFVTNAAISNLKIRAVVSD